MIEASDFSAGDVVLDAAAPDRLGIVAEVVGRGLNVVWENGGRSGGPGLVAVLRHREPRMRVEAGPGLTSDRWAVRQRAVGAALARARIRLEQGAT